MPVTTPPLSAPMNHVLVDYENVHHLNLDLVGDKPVSFVLLLGPGQTKLAAEMFEHLATKAASVHLVRISAKGKNAVDFALAYYLGQAVLADSGGYFHLVSKDTGYDPLIAHLRARRINVRRHESCATLTFCFPESGVPAAQVVGEATVASKAAENATKTPTKKAAAKVAKPANGAPSRDAMQDLVKKRLTESPSNRPARRKTLASRISNWLRDEAVSEPEVQAIIERAVQAGWLRFDAKDHPVYRL